MARCSCCWWKAPPPRLAISLDRARCATASWEARCLVLLPTLEVSPRQPENKRRQDDPLHDWRQANSGGAGHVPAVRPGMPYVYVPPLEPHRCRDSHAEKRRQLACARCKQPETTPCQDGGSRVGEKRDDGVAKRCLCARTHHTPSRRLLHAVEGHLGHFPREVRDQGKTRQRGPGLPLGSESITITGRYHANFFHQSAAA
jgi:hypothetical protein